MARGRTGGDRCGFLALRSPRPHTEELAATPKYYGIGSGSDDETAWRIARVMSLEHWRAQRDLPLLGSVNEALLSHRERQASAPAQQDESAASIEDHDPVFTTGVGTPIEPRNFVRSFWSICNAHGIRVIKVHHL